MDQLNPSVFRPATRLATALAGALLAATMPAHADMAKRSDMYIVMVEFPVEPAQSEKVVAAVRGLLDGIVRKQEGFLHARIQREAEGGKVINYMQWRSKEDFAAFRARHKDEVSAAVGAYSPKFTFYSVEYMAEPAR